VVQEGVNRQSSIVNTAGLTVSFCFLLLRLNREGAKAQGDAIKEKGTLIFMIRYD
jgi:hypothetical protein